MKGRTAPRRRSSRQRAGAPRVETRAPGSALPPRTWTGSFAAAGRGIAESWRRGPNFRLQVAIGYAAWLLSAWLGVGGEGEALIVLAAASVLAAETANTAVEVLVDLVTRELHPLARLAKDLAAGSVLLLAAGAAATGVAVLAPVLPGLPAALRQMAAAHPAVLVVQLGLLAALLAVALSPRSGARP